MRTKSMARFWMTGLTIATLTVWGVGCADPPPDEGRVRGRRLCDVTGASGSDIDNADGSVSLDGAVAGGNGDGGTGD